MWRKYVLTLGLLLPFGANADFSATLSLGLSNMSISAGSLYNSTEAFNAGIGWEIRPQINLEFPTLNSSIDIFYQGRINSDIGPYPVGRVGGGLIWYPAGMSQNIRFLDNGIKVIDKKFAPYLMFQPMLANISVTDTVSSSDTQSFNGLTIGVQLGGGFEIPVSNSWAIDLKGLADFTLLGGNNTDGDNASASLKLVTYAILFGFVIHP